MADQTSAQNQPPIDLSDLLERVDGEKDFAQELLKDFVEYYPEIVESISQSIHAKDFQKLKESAHGFKGTAGNLGAKRVQELAYQLQQMGSDKRLDFASETLEEMNKELARLKSWVDSYVW